MCSIIREKEYIEKKNKLIKELCNISKEKKIKLHILKNKGLNIQNLIGDAIFIYIKSYNEFIKTMYEHDLILIYKKLVTKIYMMRLNDIKNAISELISTNNNSYIKCNICFDEKKLCGSISCPVCKFIICENCKIEYLYDIYMKDI